MDQLQPFEPVSGSCLFLLLPLQQFLPLRFSTVYSFWAFPTICIQDHHRHVYKHTFHHTYIVHYQTTCSNLSWKYGDDMSLPQLCEQAGIYLYFYKVLGITKYPWKHLDMGFRCNYILLDSVCVRIHDGNYHMYNRLSCIHESWNCLGQKAIFLSALPDAPASERTTMG